MLHNCREDAASSHISMFKTVFNLPAIGHHTETDAKLIRTYNFQVSPEWERKPLNHNDITLLIFFQYDKLNLLWINDQDASFSCRANEVMGSAIHLPRMRKSATQIRGQHLRSKGRNFLRHLFLCNAYADAWLRGSVLGSWVISESQQSVIAARECAGPSASQPVFSPHWGRNTVYESM